MSSYDECKGCEIYLKEAHGDTQCNTRASQRTFIIGNRPRVAGQPFQNTSELELALLYREQESRGSKRLLRHRLTGSGSSARLRAQPKHVLNLLRLVLLSTAENVGFVAFRVPDFVHLSLVDCYRADDKNGRGHSPWFHM
jgi:hypothetical protein